MTTVAFTQFLPDVLPYVIGCPEPLAVNAIRNACIDFCASTMYWQETQDPVSISAAAMPYDFDAPTGANVIQPMALTVGGFTILPKSADWLDANIYNWREQTADTPSYYYQPNANQFVLVPAPLAPVTVTVRAAYVPLRDGTVIDTTVYEYYLETITAGALARLCAVPGQTWSNPALAEMKKREFASGVTSATIEANKSYDRAGLRVRMRLG
jgi:hypothetical protein